MARVIIESHNMSEEFAAQVREEYGVTVVDAAKPSLLYEFQGTRAGLVSMLLRHWGEDQDSREEYESMIQG